MNLAVMNDTLEERKLHYLIEMSEKRTINEISTCKSLIEEVKLELSSLRKDLNGLKSQRETPGTPPSYDTKRQEVVQEEPQGRELPQQRQQPRQQQENTANNRPHYNDYKEGEISIEKFFNFARK